MNRRERRANAKRLRKAAHQTRKQLDAIGDDLDSTTLLHAVSGQLPHPGWDGLRAYAESEGPYARLQAASWVEATNLLRAKGCGPCAVCKVEVREGDGGKFLCGSRMCEVASEPYLVTSVQIMCRACWLSAQAGPAKSGFVASA